MIQIQVPTTEGNVSEKVYNIDDFPYFKGLFIEAERAGKKKTLISTPATFDIETTTIIPEDPEERPFAFCYQWQFCLNGMVCFGRRLEEFATFLQRLQKEMYLTEERQLVIYVHNLSYEFSFLRSFIEISDVFCLDMRKVARFTSYGCFEFRCSYILSNMTLAKFCKNSEGVTHSKLSGEDYDYNKIRTPDTELSELELAYCYNDVKGLEECLLDKLRSDSLHTIPMTSTGYVRRDFRNAMKKNKRNREHFLGTKVDADLFILLHNAFRGGDTHANIYHSNVVLENMAGRDIASSYPFQLMCRMFPMGKFTKVSADWLLNHKEIQKDYAYIFQVYLENFRYIGTCGNPYIPISKLTGRKDIVNDNGRALYGSGYITVTDIDWYIIKKEYTWKSARIGDIYISKYGELPEEFKNTLMDYFRTKTLLKGDPDHVYEYMKSKNKLNSSYGMCVTNPAKQDIKYTDTETQGLFEREKIPDDQSETEFIQDLLDKFYKSKNSFLSYQWGVWCTCWARLQLREMLWKIGEYNVYEDTDSIKFLDPEMIEPLFDNENKNLKELADKYGAFAPDKDGNILYMGQWDKDGTYKRFSTLGAKKYLYEDVSGIHATIAGVNKKYAAEFFTKHGFSAFKNGTCMPDSGHLVAYYNDDLQLKEIEIDGCKILNGANTALVNGSYTIGLTGEWLDLFEKALRNEDLVFTE